MIPTETRVCKVCGKERHIAEMVYCNGKPLPKCLHCLKDEYAKRTADKKKTSHVNHPWNVTRRIRD
jgi:hypothetical protein